MTNTSLVQEWMQFVRRQSVRTAQDKSSKSKMMGSVVALLIISYYLQPIHAGSAECESCVNWAIKDVCTPAVSGSGICATVSWVSPLLCVSVLTEIGRAHV